LVAIGVTVPGKGTDGCDAVGPHPPHQPPTGVTADDSEIGASCTGSRTVINRAHPRTATAWPPGTSGENTRLKKVPILPNVDDRSINRKKGG
jgi:hypothetical protein